MDAQAKPSMPLIYIAKYAWILPTCGYCVPDSQPPWQWKQIPYALQPRSHNWVTNIKLRCSCIFKPYLLLISYSSKQVLKTSQVATKQIAEMKCQMQWRGGCTRIDVILQLVTNMCLILPLSHIHLHQYLKPSFWWKKVSRLEGGRGEGWICNNPVYFPLHTLWMDSTLF